MVKPTKRLATHRTPSTASNIAPFSGFALLAFLVATAAIATVSGELLPVENDDTSSASSTENHETIIRDFMICRHCGQDISLSNFLLNVNSPNAIQSWNETFFRTPDVLVQELNNPVGGLFRVVSVKKAQCAKVDHWSDKHTWFPGYAWKVCVCPKCSVHLGWMFEPLETSLPAQTYPTDRGFYVLIINNVLSEAYVNSLLATESSD